MNNINSKKLGLIISTLRNQKGISQEMFAKSLGIPRSSVSQIENGNRELSFMEFLKLPGIFNLSYGEFIDLLKPKTPILKLKNINRHIKFDAQKFTQLLLYILEKCGGKPNVGETVLYKLLYFCDFDFFELYEKTLTGMKYKKMQFGPVPDQALFNPIINELTTKGLIEKIVRPYTADTLQTKYICFIPAEIEQFSPLELKVINSVISRLSDMSARQIEDHSHRDYPWLSHENNEEIEYSRVFQRTGEYAQRDYEQEFLNASAEDAFGSLDPISEEEHDYYMSLPDKK